MEDLLTNIDKIREKYGECIEKLDFINFQMKGNIDDEIKYGTVGSIYYEYTIDCEKLWNLILLPLDTKIFIRHESVDKSKWLYHGDVITFKLIKSEQSHIIYASYLMGGGYVLMDRYVIDKGDKIKFSTEKKFNSVCATFKNVLKISSNDR